MLSNTSMFIFIGIIAIGAAFFIAGTYFAVVKAIHSSTDKEETKYVRRSTICIGIAVCILCAAILFYTAMDHPFSPPALQNLPTQP